MLATRIDHIALVVADLDAAIERFVELFGMELVSDTALADGSVRMAYLRASDTMIQLISPLQPGSFADFLAQKGEGLHHICFEVPSVDSETLDTTVALQPPALGGLGARVRFLTAPVHGAVVELTEPGSA